MRQLRFFIDKVITDQGGGDHSRMIDVEELDEVRARVLVTEQLAADETIGHVSIIEVDE